ncbi:hypothetical protein EFA69_18165 [Rufibacter immobilis]|uniref:Uncharacterized protein n=1 Tax=Rufibacter immobilis TaxID=1348778 RepID=A0A3M9MR89_9BACT|nr:hypothetical protein EFA69_18165 [Rufibacter immobilis]
MKKGLSSLVEAGKLQIWSRIIARAPYPERHFLLELFHTGAFRPRHANRKSHDHFAFRGSFSENGP